MFLCLILHTACDDAIGNWCAADDWLDSDFIFQEAHSVLSCYSAAEPKAMSSHHSFHCFLFWRLQRPVFIYRLHTSILFISHIYLRSVGSTIVTFSFDSLKHVARHLIWWTVASVDLFDDGGPENGRFCRLSSLYFCGRLTGIKDGGVDLLSILVNNLNFTLWCSCEAFPGSSWGSLEPVVEHPRSFKRNKQASGHGWAPLNKYSIWGCCLNTRIFTVSSTSGKRSVAILLLSLRRSCTAKATKPTHKDFHYPCTI